MVNCPDCGADNISDDDYCGDCGAELQATTPSGADDSFLQRYGAAPLPLASERGELVGLYGNLLGSIPVVGSVMKLFAGLSFWCYSLWLKIFTAVTLNADIMDRFTADFSYLKESFYSGYEGIESPPEPPQ